MQTTIASALRGNYHEVTPGNMPQGFDPAWGVQVRDRLRHELAGFGLVKELNLDENGIIHLDLKRCTNEKRVELFGTLVNSLQAIGLHSPTEGVEYCTLQPGIGES